MLDVRFRPLLDPNPGQKRQHSRFRVPYSETLELLEHELKLLGAHNIVISAGYATTQIRNDGWPRSGAKPCHPAVVLSFESRRLKMPLQYPCDTFRTSEDNIRAIALSLEALRTVDRYGVTRRAEQYRGWTALPPASNDQKDFESDKSAEQHRARLAALCLMRFGGLWEFGVQDIVGDREIAQKVYRRAAFVTHPDRNKGQDTKFLEVQNAWACLQKHQGGA